jgi:hypothetical protein
MLGYSDSELAALGGYDLVHYDDLSYISSAHQEREFANNKRPTNHIHSHSNNFTFLVCSFKNWSIGNDCVQVSEERWRVAVASNKLKISL